MKKESLIAKKKARLLEQLAEVNKEEQILKRKRIAKELAQQKHRNQLLGWALSEIMDVSALKKLHGRLGQSKNKLVRVVAKRSGDVVTDDSDYVELLSYINELIRHKERVSIQEEGVSA